MALSSRAGPALAPAHPYWALFFEALGAPFSAASPRGAIALCVAENALGAPIVAARLAAARAAPPAPSALFYDDMCGRAARYSSTRLT